MKIRLVRPNIELKDKAIAFRQEFFDNEEMIINGSELLDKTESYDDWLKAVMDNAKEETVNPDWVVTDTYFALDEMDNIVGIIDLRHCLLWHVIQIYHLQVILNTILADHVHFP
ncbi:MAG: hypothetical protein K2H29_00010 [Oscillospiraceae bacterium]|nr:hypothetical protein [Oscillospiraceae bacterium]